MLRKLLVAAIAFVQIIVPAMMSVAPAMAQDVSLDALLEAGHWKRLRQRAEPQAADKQNPQAAYFLSCAKTAFEGPGWCTGTGPKIRVTSPR